MNKSRENALKIFLAGVNSVKPGPLIRKWIRLHKDAVSIGKEIFPLSSFQSIYVLGAGKASAYMAEEVESIMGENITEGHILTKYDHTRPLKKISITEAGHPIPDEQGMEGTRALFSLAGKAKEKDLVLFLLSGGASSLMADPTPTINLNDLAQFNQLMLHKGLRIEEINTLRKHLSTLKGGQMTRAISPATSVSFILSDVVGDPLEVIGSGPTTPDNTTFQDALRLLDQYALRTYTPTSVIQYLEEGAAGLHPETLKTGENSIRETRNILIGNNQIALESACKKAKEMGYNATLMTSTLTGEVQQVASYLSKFAREKQLEGVKKHAYLFGGETTLSVTGKGKGGRNQHLALLAAQSWSDLEGATLLCAGTDGTDGPTEAAGAVVDNKTLLHSREKSLNLEQHLLHFNAYPFFKKEGGLIITGPTGTNVMDIIILLIE